MPALVLRTTDTYRPATRPPKRPTLAGRDAPGPLETLVALGILFGIAAGVMALRVGVYVLAHRGEPILEPVMRVFG